MIKINYQRIGEEHLDKIRKIIGVEKGYKASLDEARKLANDHYMEVHNILNDAGIYVDMSEAEQIIGRMLLGLKQYAQVDTQSTDEQTIDLGMLGDAPVDDESGTILTHELGHARDAVARGADSYQQNPILGELVAIYYAWFTTKDRKIFDEHMSSIEGRYQRFAERHPEMIQGATLTEMKAKAIKIAKEELGAATPEQRAMKRQGKKRRNGGSGSYTGLKGIRS